MKKQIVGVVAALPFVAWTAQFIPESGGYLDADENWTDVRSVCAVAKPQSGPLLLSRDHATLPGGQGSLNYWTYTYTNDFGGMTLNMNSKSVLVDRGATLCQLSGGIDARGAASCVTGTDSPSRLVLSGSGSSFLGYQFYVDALGSSVLDNEFEVSEGSKMSLAGGFLVSGGKNAARVTIDGEGSSLTSDTSLILGCAETHDMNVTVADTPEVVRQFRICNKATAGFKTGVTVGKACGGNELLVSDGAMLTAGDLTLAEVRAISGNAVAVSDATVALTGNCVIGGSEFSFDNTVVVTNGGIFSVSAVLNVGRNGTGNGFWVAGVGSRLSVAGKAFVGGRSGETGPTAPTNNVLRVTEGASVGIADDVLVGMSGGAGNSILVSSNAAFFAKSVSLYSGNSLVVNDSRLELTNGISMTMTESIGSVAVLSNSTVVLGKVAYAPIGGNASMLSFVDSVVEVPRRWSVQGRDFTMRLDNSSLLYQADDWFITGGTTSESTEMKRTFVFEGENPHLRIAGSKGLFLRGGVDLVFNLGSAGFPKDHAVVDLECASAVFNGNDLDAHRIVVNVSDDCPSGKYTLMRGKNCGTFLTAPGAYYVSPARHRLIRTTENGVDVLQVKVSNSGLVLIFR